MNQTNIETDEHNPDKYEDSEGALVAMRNAPIWPGVVLVLSLGALIAAITLILE